VHGLKFFPSPPILANAGTPRQITELLDGGNEVSENRTVLSWDCFVFFAHAAIPLPQETYSRLGVTNALYRSATIPNCICIPLVN
jgi:hypothetical protein